MYFRLQEGAGFFLLLGTHTALLPPDLAFECVLTPARGHFAYRAFLLLVLFTSTGTSGLFEKLLEATWGF
jgi:hypothetical protein